MWLRILYYAIKRNGWQQLIFYLSNLGLWRFIEYSKIYMWINEAKSGGRIVELGSGYSVFPCFFSSDEYIAVDLSVSACRYQENNGTRSIVADIARLPFKSAALSKIVAISSIEHVPEDRAVFREIARVLRDDGIALISVPFSATKSRVTTLSHPKWQLALLHKYKKLWRWVIGDMQMQYFMSQISTDSIIKYYCLEELREILTECDLVIAKHDLFGKKILGGFFKFFPSGWFICKDIIIGWPLQKFEESFCKNDIDASGIMFMIKKKRQATTV